MSRALRITQTVHVIAAGTWLGSLVMTGAYAGLVFRTLRTLNPALPDFAAYPGEHWRLAGGMLAARLFVASDIVQFACLMVAGATFALAVLALGLPLRRAACSITGAVIIALIAVLSYQFFLLMPDLTEHTQAYWDAARAGDAAAAASHRAVVDALHPKARTVMTVNAALVLILLAAGAWWMTPARPTPAKTQLEEPALAGRGS